MGLSLVPVAELPLGYRFLRLGTKGRDVRELQKELTGLGFLAGSLHGEYDFLTKEAVKNFQRAFHLAADGIVGPKTRRMLAEPGIWNRQCHVVEEGENLTELAARYRVFPGAWKDPAGRRRITRVSPGDCLLLEKRELWLAEEEIRPEDDVFCTRVLCRNLPPVTADKIRNGPSPKSGLNRTHMRVSTILSLLSPRVVGKEEMTGGKEEKAGSVVVDLRNTGGIRTPRRVRGKIRKELRALRRSKREEVFWWFASGDEPDGFPEANEADGILFSAGTWPPADWGKGYAVYTGWQKEVKSLLTRYPCTRVIIHFDLRSRELRTDGEIRLLPAGQSRALRLFQPGRRQRLENGWLQLQSTHGEEEHNFYIADRNTVRKIFSVLDRLNLRGVFFTGIRGLEGTITKEAAQFFLVLP